MDSNLARTKTGRFRIAERFQEIIEFRLRSVLALLFGDLLSAFLH